MLLSSPLWYAYICNRNEQLYFGIITDLAHRMNQHKADFLHSEKYPDKHLAANRERKIKDWARQKKLALINNSAVSLP